MQGERSGTVRRLGSDKLASLILQKLAKCKLIKFNDKCTKIIRISAVIMQYTCKN